MPQHGASTFDGSIQRGHPGEKDREFETGFPNTDHLCDVRAFARAVLPPDFPIERLCKRTREAGQVLLCGELSFSMSPASAPSVLKNVVNDIKPIHEAVQNRPANRLPLDIGNDHGKRRAAGNALFYNPNVL